MTDRYRLRSRLCAELGVPPDASRAEIETAYRRLARALHPDSADPGAVDVERLQRVLDAHAMLSSPALRADDVRRLTETTSSTKREARTCPVCRGAATFTTPCACRSRGYEHVTGPWIATVLPCRACFGSGIRRLMCGACGGTGATHSRCGSTPANE
jgi:DnaJ-class molecular chaperone